MIMTVVNTTELSKFDFQILDAWIYFLEEGTEINQQQIT